MLADKPKHDQLGLLQIAWEVAKFIGVSLIGFSVLSALMWVGLIVWLGMSISAM